MSNRPCRVLFLCTGNSARSVMAEAALNRLGGGRFEAFSAGSMPAGRVNPFTIERLKKHGYAVDHLRSKSWDEFAQSGSPEMDLIITVCDNAAGEVCPVWPGRPIATHWSFEDPAAYAGPDEEKRMRFEKVYQQIYRRIEQLAVLPTQSLDGVAFSEKLKSLEHGGS
jgi:arsenate reductase